MNPTHFFLAFMGLAVWPLGSALQATDGPRGEVAPKLAADGPAADIAGIYEVHGVEAPEKTYRGIAEIVRQGEVYVVSWLIDGQSVIGVGIRDGNRLAVSWATPRDGGIIRGVNVYTITGKRLDGRWTTFPGNGRLKTERLTFLKSPSED